MSSDENLFTVFSRGALAPGGKRVSCPSPVESFITFEFFKNEGFPTIDDDDFDFDYVRHREDTTQSEDTYTAGTSRENAPRATQTKYDLCAKKLHASRRKRKRRTGDKAKRSTSQLEHPVDSMQKLTSQFNQTMDALRVDTVIYTTSQVLDQPDPLRYRACMRRNTDARFSQDNERRSRVDNAQGEFDLESILASPLDDLQPGLRLQPSFHIPTREDNHHDARTEECIRAIEKALEDKGVEDKRGKRTCRDKQNKRESDAEIPPLNCQYFASAHSSQGEIHGTPPCQCEGILCTETPCKYHEDMARGILAKYGITDLKLDEYRPINNEETNLQDTPDSYGMLEMKLMKGIDNK